MLLRLYTEVEVLDDFKQQYARTISNWSYLSYHLSNNKPSASHVGRLIRLELDTKRRPEILRRLVQRLGMLVRQQLQEELQEVLDEGKCSRWAPN